MSYIGETLTIRLEWYGSTGALQSPASATLSVVAPSGTAATPTLTTVAVGIQTASYTPTENGMHQYRAVAQGVGSDTVVVQDRFYVEPKNV